MLRIHSIGAKRVVDAQGFKRNYTMEVCLDGKNYVIEINEQIYNDLEFMFNKKASDCLNESAPSASMTEEEMKAKFLDEILKTDVKSETEIKECEKIYGALSELNAATDVVPSATATMMAEFGGHVLREQEVRELQKIGAPVVLIDGLEEKAIVEVDYECDDVLEDEEEVAQI
ncbi:MAG: hypothetical protein ACXAEU_23795 [Candidatus Hodarchaeales archaeon]|jgi:hypothetical protein